MRRAFCDDWHATDTLGRLDFAAQRIACRRTAHVGKTRALARDDDAAEMDHLCRLEPPGLRLIEVRRIEWSDRFDAQIRGQHFAGFLGDSLAYAIGEECHGAHGRDGDHECREQYDDLSRAPVACE